jgi:RNA polymerase sigma-70 factor (ECF subfamily)
MLARARRVVVDPHLAEEAVQEALVRAWRSCASFDPAGGPLVNWLLVITRNAAIDMARTRSRRPALASHAPDLGDDRLDTGLSGADLVLIRAELVDALVAIGPHHREAVVEVVLRDRSYDAVASDLGVPAGTLRTRVHYGLRALRAALSDQDAA